MSEVIESQNESIEQDEIIITLIDRYGNQYNATLLTIFQAGDNEQDYMAVLSHIKDKDGSFPIQIFRYNTECMEIENIQSDMEFEAAYNKLLLLIDDGI